MVITKQFKHLENMEVSNRTKDKHRVSSKQKGDIAENRISEIITLGSQGNLNSYKPISDDDGIDLIVNLKSDFKPIFIQVKSRFNLQKSGQFVQNVSEKTLQVHNSFLLAFVYFNEDSLEIDKIWLVPSIDFVKIAYRKKKGKSYNAFYRFSANPKSTKDRWAKFVVDKTDLGDKLAQLMVEIYANSSVYF